MSTPKDRLEAPYKATHAETCDEFAKTVQRLVLNDGPLQAITMVADGNAHGVAKHAKGDWRTRSQEYFLPKVLRHLHQHYGDSMFGIALNEMWDTLPLVGCNSEPEYLDAESGVPHLAKAATNILMSLENYGNVKDEEVEVIPPEEYGMVYLASPYTVNPDLSCEIAKDVVAGCVAEGIPVYAPTLYGHIAAKDGSYDYWIRHGMKLLEACDSIVFVKAEGLGPWENSEGCKKEMELASEMGLKAYELNYNTKTVKRL